jgi:Helicase HerA, central domain
MSAFEHGLKELLIIATLTVGGGIGVASLLRVCGLSWTWAAPGAPLALALMSANIVLAFTLGVASLLACMLGARWHNDDLRHGGDLGEVARQRLGVIAVLARLHRLRRQKRARWVNGSRMIVGRDRRGLPVTIPVGHSSGSHTLVVGATGAGKTVTQTWIACRLIEAGHGAIVIDPKGDALLFSQLQEAAVRCNREFLCWTPEGPLTYNPYAQGSDTELADKALAGERFTEPHYQRQAQRYLGHVVRTMRAADIAVTSVSLMAHLDPRQLEVSARSLPEDEAAVVESYLDSLNERQRRELAGVRDRLSILAESDAREWLDETDEVGTLDLRLAIAAGAVAYFRLDADRRVLLSQMLAAAIVSDP